MEQLYLTRRNLLTLLHKLDRARRGQVSACTLVKQDTLHPTFPCSTAIQVTALEDEAYYTDRPAGVVHPLDEPKGLK